MDVSCPREGGGTIKPLILRVGVALLLSASGLIMAKLLFRKQGNELTSSARNPESLSSRCRRNDGGEDEEETESLDDDQKVEIFSLKSRFEELQRKEYEMELRFERFCKLKDQEVMLVEHKSMLSLEKSQLDFFRREVVALEEEHKRGQDLVIVCLKLVKEIQGLRSENGLLVGKVKQLRRRGKQLYQVVNEKSRRVIGVEKEFLRCIDELETKNKLAKELEGEVKDLKARPVDALQQEKIEATSQSQSELEIVSVEEYRRVLEEYEELKKDFADGVKEVINLRWRNACLRHAVMRNGTNYGEITFSPNRTLQEFGMEDDQGDNALALTVAEDSYKDNHQNHHHESSRRKRLMKKLKRWVEGNEKGKSTKSEDRCFRKHSLTVEPEDEQIFHSRRSCSSV